MSKFSGSHYDPALDHNRLENQMGRVYEVMKDGIARTLGEIHDEILQRFQVDDPEPSISAQIGNLRKPNNGSHIIETRARAGLRTSGVFERIYRGQRVGTQKFWYVTCVVLGTSNTQYWTSHHTVSGSRPVDAAEAAAAAVRATSGGQPVIPWRFRRWDPKGNMWGPQENFNWVTP